MSRPSETLGVSAFEPVRREGPTGATDTLLLGAVVALLVIGTLMVYSASFVVAHNEFGDDLYFLTRQLAAIGLGGLGMLVAARTDYRRLRGVSLLAMLACIALLLLVLAPGLGKSSYGSVRWLKLGPVQLQPSELAKLGVVLYLADWLARRRPILRQFSNGSLPFVVIVTIVAGLVELQPDLGTAFVIVAAAACIFFVAGANLLHVGVFGSLGALVGIGLISRLASYRQDRIAAFLDPWADLQGSGWHTAQTLIALGSGGPWGLGLGASRQKFYWVPNAHTDAIYAIIGEELGLPGTLGVLVLFGIVAWRGFRLAWNCRDPFGRLLATGLTSLLAIQALVNIAVVTNSVPFTGVTLPLLSYGGNSTVVSMLAVGLLLSIGRHPGGSATEPGADQADVGGSSGVAALSGGLPGAEPRRLAALAPSARRPHRTFVPRAAQTLEPSGRAGSRQARPSRRRALSRQRFRATGQPREPGG